jgi:L-cysteine:1D-myo-inositol 2-amino-2-deoxy-alpha-D-glucopyranoside ligase
VRPPDFYPRATDVIEDIVTTVQKLLDAGVAYESDGNVYYHIDAWPTFGKLSRLPRADMLPIANQRGNKPNDPHKQDPLDFVLWQAQAPGEPAWASPWGPGRPGWHIECSTMSTRFLGHIDIHGGGGDLVFPHHECEIAQAEPLLKDGRPFTRFWLHIAMVYHEGEKMSKSLGNLVMVRNLLQQGFTPDGLRLYFGGHHYRKIWSYNEPELRQAEALAQKLRAAYTASGGIGLPLDPTPAWSAFNEALANDLDTPTALSALSRLADDILEANTPQSHAINAAKAVLCEMSTIFGLRLDAAQPEPQVITGWNEHLKRFKNAD